MSSFEDRTKPMSELGMACARIYAKPGYGPREVARYMDGNRFRWNWRQLNDLCGRGGGEKNGGSSINRRDTDASGAGGTVQSVG